MSVNIKTPNGLTKVAGAGGNVIDDTLSSTSVNPVENRVIKNKFDEINIEIDSLKKSGSEGKKVVADALTEMGISTATDASFDIIAENIKKITTGTDTSDANALASEILSGKTAYVKGEKIVGTITNRGVLNWNANNTTYAVPAGYYSGGTLDSRGSYQSGYTAGQNATKIKYIDGTIGVGNSIPATEVDCGFLPDIIIIYWSSSVGDNMPFLSLNYPYLTGYILATQEYDYSYTLTSYRYDFISANRVYPLYPDFFSSVKINNFARKNSGFSIGPIGGMADNNNLKYKAIKFT